MAMFRNHWLPAYTKTTTQSLPRWHSKHCANMISNTNERLLSQELVAHMWWFCDQPALPSSHQEA